MNKKKRINSNKTTSNIVNCSFDLYEEELPSYHNEFMQFLSNEPELEDAQMVRALTHDEIFPSNNTVKKQKNILVHEDVQVHKQDISVQSVHAYLPSTNYTVVASPTSYTVVAPRHLRSLAEICKTYGKGRESVKKWFDEGAPIAFDGFSYFSEYHALQNWLVERGRKLKNQ